MDIDELRNYCIQKKEASESFPFDESTLVFKVLNKMFAIVPLDLWDKGENTITLKCDPEYSTKLRETYKCIYAGPYVSNKHWNTVAIYKNELTRDFIFHLIDHSYNMVVIGMNKAQKKLLQQ